MEIINYRLQIRLTKDQYFDLIGSDAGDFKPTILSLGATDISLDIFGGIVFNVTSLTDATKIEKYVMTVLASLDTSNS